MKLTEPTLTKLKLEMQMSVMFKNRTNIDQIESGNANVGNVTQTEPTLTKSRVEMQMSVMFHKQNQH